SGFVGEFMILVGAFDSPTLPAVLPILGAVGVIIAAVYLLNMFRKVMFGPAESAATSQIFDLKAREIAIMMPLIVLMFWVGLYATLFLSSINASAESLLQALSLLEPATFTVLP
ncbi:MAG: Fe-S-binding domain-containing protein, partial [Bacteroidota bacterium]